MWEKLKSAASTGIKWISGKFDDLKSAVKKVKTAFSDIQKAVSEKMESVQKKVKGVVDKVKGFLPFKVGKIFSGLKIPKISVSGGKAPYGIAGLGKAPKISVKWNAEGGILTKPTIFGMTGNTLLGGGEAGKEAIAPIDKLQAYQFVFQQTPPKYRPRIFSLKHRFQGLFYSFRTISLQITKSCLIRAF